MKYSKAVEIMMQLKAEYFYVFKDMPDDLFKIKVGNFMKALEGYSDKEIDIALGVVLKENKTLPTTACFIEVLERNRELLLPSAEEEWNSISEAVAKIKRNRDITDIYLRCEKNEKIYLSLSSEVRGYYVNYCGFLELVEMKSLEVARSQFLKGFAEYRKRQKQKDRLMKEI